MRRSRWITAVLASSTLLVAACGSDDDDEAGGSATTAAGTAAPTTTGGSGTTGAPTTTTSSSGGEQAGAKAVADAEAAAKAKPMKATGDPVVIGFQNPEGDPNGTFPEFSVAAQAAVNYINEELGGIGADYKTGTPGRPIKLELCKMTINPADSQRCANEIAGKKPFAVISSLNFFGNHFSIYQAANIPVIVGAPVSINDFTAPNTFAIGAGGGCLGMDTGRMDYVTRALGKTKISVGYIDTAPGRVCYNSFTKASLDVLAGKTMDGAPVTAAGNTVLGKFPSLTHTGVAFAAGGADMTPQATKLLEFKPDAISFSGQLADCWTFIDTLKKLNWNAQQAPLLMGSGCIDIKRLTDMGADAKGITFVGAQSVFDPSVLTGQLKAEAETYQAKMKQYGGTEVVNRGFAPQGFGLVMSVWEIANEQAAGKPATLDAAKFASAMAATKNHHAYLSTGISCADGAGSAPYVSVCSTAVTAQEWDGTKLVPKQSNFSGFHLVKGTKLAGA